MQSIYQLVTLVLTWLAVPVVLVYAYDKWVLEPRRPRTPEGEREPGPLYARIAGNLLPFVLIAVVITIGAKDVFDWAGEVAVPLSWASLPLVTWLAIDSWFFAPRRQIAAGSVDVPDPPLLRAAYWVLPVFVIAPIVRMIRAESLDFSLVLLALSVVTGVVWGIDHWLVRPRREAAAAAAKPAVALGEPGTVDYARSFFPVAAIVLLVRAFIFEPFRIPSDSMMPTLLDGDFIVVNKYAYGLRLPVANRKFLDTGSPLRGDVVVFRYPPDPKINYIKRLVGLPGDRVEVREDRLVINGVEVAQQPNGLFNDGCYVDMRLATETLGEHTHQVISCHSPDRLKSAWSINPAGASSLPSCDRQKIARDIGAYYCDERGIEGTHDLNNYTFDVVPPGHYIMIGDNRDNSEDSRVWKLVPDENLVGKATRIWFNFDPQRKKFINWSRIGNGIQ